MPNATVKSGNGLGAFSAPNIQPVEIKQVMIKYIIVFIVLFINRFINVNLGVDA